MRILIKLEALNTVSQEHFHKQYFTDIHGKLAAIAGKDDKYGKFCFGNLFPIRDRQVELGKEYSVIVSSSEPSIIEKLFFSFEIGLMLNVGESQFRIKEVSIEQRKLKNTSVIESISPVSITTHSSGTIRSHKLGDEEYIKHLEKKLLNKYSFLTGNKPELNLFENVSVSAHEKRPDASFQINFFNKEKNKHFLVIGSKLVFKFNRISDEQLKVFQTLFDAGFGERTTFGAGFMVERWEKK